MKIGVLLGSFDPIHNGHLSMVAEALNNRGIDKVILVPAWHNPWKELAVVEYGMRASMCQVAVDDIVRYQPQWVTKVIVSCEESMLACRSVNSTIYSSLTLKALSVKYTGHELYIICGSDVARAIPEWHEGQWIVDHYGVVEINRPGASENNDSNDIMVSSTAIRTMLAEGKCPLPYLPGPVYQYIKKYGLYTNEKSNLNENSNGTDC